jgi:hypothetical protein
MNGEAALRFWGFSFGRTEGRWYLKNDVEGYGQPKAKQAFCHLENSCVALYIYLLYAITIIL